MAKYALTVYPITDGPLCSNECRFLVNRPGGFDDDGCAAFDEHVDFSHNEDGENRFKRRPACIESERSAKGGEP